MSLKQIRAAAGKKNEEKKEANKILFSEQMARWESLYVEAKMLAGEMAFEEELPAEHLEQFIYTVWENLACEKGIVPPHWSGAAHCQRCGVVAVEKAQDGARVAGCPWCHYRVEDSEPELKDRKRINDFWTGFNENKKTGKEIEDFWITFEMKER